MKYQSIFSLALLAMAGMLAASCNKHAGSAKEAEVTFTVNLAQNPSTKVDGVSEASLIDALDVFVYDAAGSYLSTVVPTVTKTDQTHYNVRMRLLNNVKYNFVFFAQKSGTYAYAADKKTITIDYAAMTANSDAADAFCARVNDYTVSGNFSKSVTLSRPFAQVNFGAAKADYQAAEASKVSFDTSLKTAITLQQVPTVLNLLTGVVSAPQDVAFQPGVYMGNSAGSETLTVSADAFPGATPVRYLGMVYILADANASSPLAKVGLNVSGVQNGKAFSSVREITNVPVRANYRTQIVGNIFTDEGYFTITVEPAYLSPDNATDL